MAIQLRQQVLDLIDTNLSTGSSITAVEHRAVEQAIVNYVGFNMVAYGRIGPIDIANASTSWTTTGNLLTATRIGGTGDHVFMRVTFPTGLLSDSNFKVRIDIEADGDMNLANNLDPVLFKKVSGSTDRFDLVIEETETTTSTIYLHVEVLQLRDI
jgi:hypothetical protein